MRLLFLRLSNKRDTAASSTHGVLADLALTACPDAEIEFAYLPPRNDPRVTGSLSGRDWTEFDLILVTNAFVLEALNLPWLLAANGQAAWAVDRAPAFPPILLGGSNAFAAQCLVKPDGVAVPDVLFFGEAEDVLGAFLRNWAVGGCAKRARLVEAVGGLAGFWVTGGLPAGSVQQAVARGGAVPAAEQPLPDTEWAGVARLAVGAGCASFCSFCFEGYERKPYREFPVARVMEQARSLKVARGARAVELDAFNLNTYSGLDVLVESCVRLFESVSFKSQRADGLAASPTLIDLERAAGKGSFTLGIEGVSARLRAFLCKSLSDGDMDAAVQALLARRVRELKLFYILTGHETAADLAEFGAFCGRLSGWLAAPRACTRVIVSVGRLVRMPNTPLIYDRLFLVESEWRFGVDGISAACRRAGLECRFALEWPDYLATQLLAACGHEHAESVVRLACEGLSYHGPWRNAEAVRLREVCSLSGSPTFPFVRRAVGEGFLRARWELARQFLDGGYCLGGECGGCGACADVAERKALVGHARGLVIRSDVVGRVAAVEAEKRRLVPVYCHACLPAEYAGRSPGWVGANLLRHVLRRHPGLVENLLSVDEALFGFGSNVERLVVPAGATVVRFRAWDRGALLGALAGERDWFPARELPDSFEPGLFERAVWTLGAALSARDAARVASEWLQEQKLPHMLRRAGEDWAVELAPAARKKRTVLDLSVSAVPGGAVVKVSFTPKCMIRSLRARLPVQVGGLETVCTEVVVGASR